LIPFLVPQQPESFGVIQDFSLDRKDPCGWPPESTKSHRAFCSRCRSCPTRLDFPARLSTSCHTETRR